MIVTHAPAWQGHHVCGKPEDGHAAGDLKEVNCPECRAAIQRAWGENKVVQVACNNQVIFALRADGRVFETERYLAKPDDTEFSWREWKALSPIPEE